MLITAAAIAAAGLAGCTMEEQAHSLILGNGAYTSEPDTPLSAAKLSALKDRALRQAGGGEVGGGGTPAAPAKGSAGRSSASPVASKDSSSVPEAELENRVRMQSGN